jgi:hypothetical protein
MLWRREILYISHDSSVIQSIFQSLTDYTVLVPYFILGIMTVAINYRIFVPEKNE